MAQEVRVLLFCDRHRSQQHEDVEAVTRRFSIDGAEYETEMCGACSQELVEPLRQVLEQVARKGRAISNATPQPRTDPKLQKAECPVCHHVLNRGSLSAHCRQQHGKTLQEIQVEYGVQIVRPRKLRQQPQKKTALKARKAS